MWWPCARIQERALAAVIFVIRVEAVGPAKWWLGHDNAIWIRSLERRPAVDPCGQLAQGLPVHVTDNALPCSLLPPALGFPVIHDHVRIA